MATKRKTGRPVTTGTSPQVALRLPPELLLELDAWRAEWSARNGGPELSRSAAMKMAIERMVRS